MVRKWDRRHWKSLVRRARGREKKKVGMERQKRQENAQVIPLSTSGKEWAGDEIKGKTVGAREKSAGGRETEKWCILQCYASATAATTTATNTVDDDAFTTKPSYD